MTEVDVPDGVSPQIGSHVPSYDKTVGAEARFQAFVDSVFDAYYDWHIPTGFMDFSVRMDSLLGLSLGSLPRAFSAWLERLHPEDRDRTMAEVEKSIHTGEVYEDNYRLRCADGSYIWVHDRGVVLKEEGGRATHMVGAIRDVTQEREAERALREAAELYHTLFEYAVNPSYQVGEDGRFLDANEAGLSFLKTTRTALIGEMVDSQWGSDAKAAVMATAKLGGSVKTLELELSIGGSFKALAVTLVPCRLRGNCTCFALGTDVTEHHLLRQALEESQESLRRQATALEDTNTALRVILDQRSRDRAELERTIAANVEAMILPLMGKLSKRLALRPEAVYLDALARSVREITQPFTRSLSALTNPSSPLTPREREIANLIRAGKSTNEIAAALYLSPATVTFHRKNLRKKLGLAPGGSRLITRLAQLVEEPEAVAASSLVWSGANNGSLDLHGDCPTGGSETLG